ncbi:uncharacterized protein [Miscanthus floridulus]|uniref:uncharacterized protein n=1 Tax=Miscanthus floridulus TaxID=154761 RepID=UPI00345AA245
MDTEGVPLSSSPQPATRRWASTPGWQVEDRGHSTKGGFNPTGWPARTHAHANAAATPARARAAHASALAAHVPTTAPTPARAHAPAPPLPVRPHQHCPPRRATRGGEREEERRKEEEKEAAEATAPLPSRAPAAAPQQCCRGAAWPHSSGDPHPAISATILEEPIGAEPEYLGDPDCLPRHCGSACTASPRHCTNPPWPR